MVRKSRKSREEWKIYKNVFDSHTERLLFNLASQGHFVELKSPIALGKEANVFLAEKTDGTYVIVKIYRLENCNFNKMYSYIIADPRFEGLENQKRKVIFTWVQREYRNLLLARQKIKVPTPFAFKDNIIVMESIGNDHPAQKLKDQVPSNPTDFFKKTKEGMLDLAAAGLVHGDLSEFNILNENEQPIFIDFSQGTTVLANDSTELFTRDAKNVIKFFKRFLKIDEDKELKALSLKFDKIRQKAMQ